MNFYKKNAPRLNFLACLMAVGLACISSAQAATTPTLGSFTIPTKVYGDAPFRITPPTSTSKGAWTYQSGNNAVATVSGSTITVKGAGSTVILATQAAWGSYDSIRTSTTFTVTPAVPQLGAFTVPAKTNGDAPFALTPPTSSSTGTWSYTSSVPSVATVSGSNVTILGVGTTTITATQAATANYTSASTSNNLVVNPVVTPRPPVIGPFTVPSTYVGAAPFVITPPTSTSSGSWSYSSGNASIATISSNTLTAIGAGTVVITATQAASGVYTSASGSATLTVLSNALSPNLGSFVIPTKTFGSAPLAITPPTSRSPGAWSYVSGNSNVASISGGTLTITGVGKTLIQATLAASGVYSSASTAASFTATPGTPQLGSFVIPVQLLSSSGFILTPPTSSSSGSWSYSSSEPRVATVSGNTVTLLSAGKTTITARQAATANWLAAKTNALLVVTNAAEDTFGTGNNTFTISFVPIGNPGNTNNATNGYGRVPYSYWIGKYTVSQNQIDAATRSGLTNVTAGAWGGNQPAASITWYQAAAYVNWLNSSKGYPPAYNLAWDSVNGWSMALWPTIPDASGNVAWTNGGTNRFRNANCVYFLPSENEWFKAAYYDPVKNSGTPGYWLYSVRTDTDPLSISSGTNAQAAVYNQSLDSAPALVSQAGGLSSYGTMGQGGNIWQWMETSLSTSNTNTLDDRVIRGGGWYSPSSDLRSSGRASIPPNLGGNGVGFRVGKKP